MIKKWEVKNKSNVDKRELQEKIQKDFGLSNLLSQILVNRGIETEEEIRVFLNPTRADFHDPFLMPDMDKAVERILQAIHQKEKIIIYGDYDVDGITSITVLKQFLEERGVEVSSYIPNRLEEGYGLNKKAVEWIASQGFDLMITVDCGISGIEEVEYASSLGIETVITDHHEPLEILPNAVAVVDPKIQTSKYPFRGLAGVGVVFKTIQAIGKKLQLPEKEYLKYLDIVCIGTISDIVPLVDENRVITKLGLKLVERTQNIGLKELIEASGYRKIDSTMVSFGIAPRINACGRMGQEQEALQLFLTQDRKEAKQITEKLNEYNKQRQTIEKEILEEAIQKVEQEPKSPCIVLGDEKWHHGVIGIVSSKITDLYFKPSILVCFEENIGKGSGRSIPGFDLHEALGKCSNYLEKYGGHEMAVGVTLKEENFIPFKKVFEEVVLESHIENLMPVIAIEEQIDLKEITIGMVKELNLLEPFGEANKMPIFMFHNLKIDSIRSLSEGKHLKLTLKDDHLLVGAIGFNMGHLAEEYLIGDRVDVAGILEINSFNGMDSIQINIKDMRKTY